jgi:2'-5' RNA ligase
MAKRIRTFIAIEMSEAIRRRAASLQAELSAHADHVKWVEPQQMHLTLKFLGDVDETSIYSVCRLVQQVAEPHAPFELTVAGTGAFPNLRRPRTLWIGVSASNGELAALQRELEVELAREGYPREERGFTPHVTLGRIRHIVPNPTLEQAMLEHQSWHGGVVQVREVLVMSSTLGPAGPSYAVLARARLGK